MRLPRAERNAGLWLLIGLLLAGCSTSELPVQPDPVADAQRRCVNADPLRQPFFGDTHVHTRFSLDASTQGTRLGPFDAYRYALGERIGVQPYDEDGEATRFTQLARPLDFAMVTDHAEFFGEVEICSNPDAPGHNSVECILLRNAPDQSFLLINALLALPGLPAGSGNTAVPRLPFCGLDGSRCREQALTPWAEMQRAAETFYDRSTACSFSSFVAYEWTGSPGSNNLHRNVIFANERVPAYPPSYIDQPDIEQLWDALDEGCDAEEGCRWLTIPHNSNLSGGLMFESPQDGAFAARRAQAEPLIEVYQHKGDSECLDVSGAGMADEFCGFEKLPYNNFAAQQLGTPGDGTVDEQDYVRDALKRGLQFEEELGANPFAYGLIGGTDTHIVASGEVAEDDYPGHGGAGQGNRDEVPGLTDLIEFSPGGLAVIWAEQNTRPALYEAMRRREVYATSGTRPILRLFAGSEVPADMCAADNFAATGYQSGVPMGGELTAGEGAPPRVAVWAMRDPGDASVTTAQALQQLQIIKGWLDADGVLHERVHTIAGTPDNGAGVNTDTCETFGSGASSLCNVWEDPDFDPNERAFYYARVLENPSCRWSTYQCNAAGVDCNDPDSVPDGFEGCCDARYPKSIQERAWTSPVWYRPASS